MKNAKSHGEGCLNSHARAYSLIPACTRSSPTIPPSIASIIGTF